MGQCWDQESHTRFRRYSPLKHPPSPPPHLICHVLRMDRMDRMDEVRPMVMSFAFCGPSGSGKSSLLKAYLGAWKEHERSGFTQFCNKLFIAVSCTFLDSFLYLFVSFVIHIHCFSCLQKSLVLWSPSAHHWLSRN